MSSASPEHPISSGNPQPWQERLADGIVLVLATVVVLMVGWALTAESPPPLAAYAVLLAVVLAIGGALRWAGWLKLFGPLLFYDTLRSARRGRHVWARGIYAGLLLFLLFIAFLGSGRGGPGTSEARKAAELAGGYFENFMAVQLVLVLVLTPAYVAGSIAEEKDRRTLEYLLATDLRNREIVLSKLGTRLANLLLLVLTGLPILSILQFLGGVDPNLVLAGFAATGLTMLGLGGLSVFVSIHFKKPRDAIAVTYLFVLAYYAVSFLVYAGQRTPEVSNYALWIGSHPITFGDAARVFNTGNLFLILGEVRSAGGRGQLDTVVPRELGNYALFMGMTAGLCTLLAVLRLRAAALKEGVVRSRREARAPRRPPVGNHPMMWKEVFAEGGVRMNWMTWTAVAILLAATFIPVIVILGYHILHPYQYDPGWRSLQGHVNIWVRISTTVVGVLSLLAVAVRASTAYSGERDRQTLDSLLTTPLDSTPLLVGKWLGAVFSVRLAWIWLALIWGVGLATGGLSPWALPGLVIAWLVFAAFEATVGLWFSLLSRSSLRSTVWTLLATVAGGLGHWLPWTCCLVLPMVARDLTLVAKVQGGLTPPVVLFSLAFYGGELSTPHEAREWYEMMGFSAFGVFAWAVATVLLWSGLTLRMRALTLREEFMRPERGWVARRPQQVILDPLPPPKPIPIASPPRQPLSPPAQPPEPPPTRMTGAKLVDESWEKPRQQPPPS
jgi:ABC-type transport system involved in multi-copper enzyme maturation permease subunit